LATPRPAINAERQCEPDARMLNGAKHPNSDCRNCKPSLPEAASATGKIALNPCALSAVGFQLIAVI